MNHWSSDCPTRPGTYEFRCGETNYEVEAFIVAFEKEALRRGLKHSHPDPKRVWVLDTDVGSMPVDIFHNGLTNPCWRLALLPSK
jgi:hypothetical protein